MDIMGMFRNAVGMSGPNPASPQMGNQPQQPGVPNPQVVQAGNLAVANNPANPQPAVVEPVKEPSPGEAFKDLWTIDPKQKGPADLADFSFNFDPAKVNATVAGLDFTKAITPEILAKINAGGPEAMTAMLAAMNTVGQEAMKASLTTSVRVTETGLRNTGQRMKDSLPDLVRSQTVSSVLREDNPLFSDPSTAPIMELAVNQMAQKFPNATPNEIREHAKKYVVNFVQQGAKFAGVDMNPQQTAVNKQVAAQHDWSQEPT